MKWYFIAILIVANISTLAAYETKIPDLLGHGRFGEYIPKGHYQILGLSINTATLTFIKSKLGVAKRYKSEHTAQSICYRNNNEKIEFSLSSLGFGYSVTNQLSTISNCSLITGTIENGLGLKIGMDKSRVLDLLGVASESNDSSLLYSYWIQQKGTQEEQAILRRKHNMPDTMTLWLDVTSFVSISFKNDTVSEFSVYTTETF